MLCSSLPIDILAMSHPEDHDPTCLRIEAVYDAVLPSTDAKPHPRSTQPANTRWVILSEVINSSENPTRCGLGPSISRHAAHSKTTSYTSSSREHIIGFLPIAYTLTGLRGHLTDEL